MGDHEQTPLATIEALLRERQKVEQWMAQLEARRSDTPDAVYQRVLADYRERAGAAHARLAASSKAVGELATALAASLATHEDTIAVAREQQSEAALRCAVGEFTPGEWESMRAESETQLAGLERSRESLQRELAVVQALVQEAVSGQGQPFPVPATAMAVGAWRSAWTHGRSRSAVRVSMDSAPWPGAGGHSTGSIRLFGR